MMKKLWMISIASIATLTITGGVLAAQSGQFIGTSKAKDIAQTTQEGKVEEIELDQYKGKPVYEVEIEQNDRDVEVKVDAFTGNIVKVVDETNNEQKAVKQDAPVKQNTAEKKISPNESQVKEAKTATNNTAQKSVDKQAQSSSIKDDRITKEQVIAIALNLVDGKVVEVELDKEDGVLIYEIEVKNDEVEADFDIAAYGGKVLSKDIDYNEHDDDDTDNEDDDDEYDND